MSYEEQQETVEVAGFIAKTFEILNDDQYARIIYWSPSGTQFVIKDIAKFQQVVLPKFFRHNKINSFIRQLNMYGFHKSRKDHTKSVFSHPLFLKNREDLLPEIKRKIKQHEDEASTSEKILTPMKPQKIVKQEMDTAVAGKQTTEIKERPAPSLRFLQNLESIGSSFKQFFQSRDMFSSRQQLNFSINQLSQNCLGEIQQLESEEKESDKVSIEEGIEEKQEREKQFVNLPSIAKFQNPSCFFSSFILKE